LKGQLHRPLAVDDLIKVKVKS